MVSDVGYAELHRLAQDIGKFRMAFQGDHYDVDEESRVRAIAAGAVPVDSRELLRRLKAAGLRRRDPWRLVDRGPLASSALHDRLARAALPPALVESAGRVGRALGGEIEMTVLERSTEVGIALRGRPGGAIPELDPLPVAELHVWSDDGTPLIELIVAR